MKQCRRRAVATARSPVCLKAAAHRGRISRERIARNGFAAFRNPGPERACARQLQSARQARKAASNNDYVVTHGNPNVGSVSVHLAIMQAGDLKISLKSPRLKISSKPGFQFGRLEPVSLYTNVLHVRHSGSSPIPEAPIP